jgi:hypothetical protein
MKDTNENRSILAAKGPFAIGAIRRQKRPDLIEFRGIDGFAIEGALSKLDSHRLLPSSLA